MPEYSDDEVAAVIVLQRAYRRFWKRFIQDDNSSGYIESIPDEIVSAVRLQEVVDFLWAVESKESLKQRFVFYILLILLYYLLIAESQDQESIYDLSQAHVRLVESIELDDGKTIYDLVSVYEIGLWISGYFLSTYQLPAVYFSPNDEITLKHEFGAFFCQYPERVEYLVTYYEIPIDYWDHLDYLYGYFGLELTYEEYSAASTSEQSDMAVALYYSILEAFYSDPWIQVAEAFGVLRCEAGSPASLEPLFLNSYNRILGGMIVSQTRRQRANSCGPEFESLVSECYESSLSTEPFYGLLSNETYEYMEKYGGGWYWGFNHNPLIISPEEQLEEWTYMLADGWLNRASASVEATMLTVNANVGLYLVASSRFTIGIGGSIDANVNVEAVQVDPTIEGSYHITIFVLCCASFVYLVGSIARSVLSALRRSPNIFAGVFLLFRSVWMYLDIAVAVLLILLIITESQLDVARGKIDLPKSSLDSPELIASFTFGLQDVYVVRDLERILRVTQSTLMLVLISRLFRYFEFSDNFNFLLRTITRCTKELFYFFATFFIILLAYSAAANATWGHALVNFQDVYVAATSMCEMLIGENLPMEEMRALTPYFADIFLWTYVFFVVFIMFNILISIVLDGYAMAVQDLADSRAQKELHHKQKEVLFQALQHLNEKPRQAWTKVYLAFRSGSVRVRGQLIWHLSHVLEACLFRAVWISQRPSAEIFLSDSSLQEACMGVLNSTGAHMLFTLFETKASAADVFSLSQRRSSLMASLVLNDAGDAQGTRTWESLKANVLQVYRRPEKAQIQTIGITEHQV